MKKRNQTLFGILLAQYSREAGSAMIEGKKVSWQAGEFLEYVLEGDEYGKVLKLPIHPEYVENISDVVADMEWAQFVKLTLEERKVIAVEPVLLNEEITL